MSLTVEIEPQELIERETVDRGRLMLGSDYKNATVGLLIISAEDEGSESDAA